MNRLVLASLILFAACAGKGKKEESGEWKELNAFHSVMAQAFHPLKDSGNLAPAKKLASQLAEEAERWASAPLPEKVNTDEMKANLAQLKTDTKALADEIAKGATDDVVKEKLNGLHDQFHKIMEAWGGGHKHDEGEEHEHGHHDDDEEKD